MAGQNFERNSAVVAGSAFALGLAAGLLLNGVARRMYELVRVGSSHRDYERTVTYDENLPDSLGRREPPPEHREPRYGGTGGLGVHPAAGTARP
jgi:hypothetical protein